MAESEVTIIPQIRQVYRAGAAWEAVTTHSSSGAAADIPAAADLPNGSLYYETDTAKLKQVQSGAWAAIVDTSSFPTLTTKYSETLQYANNTVKDTRETDKTRWYSWTV